MLLEGVLQEGQVTQPTLQSGPVAEGVHGVLVELGVYLKLIFLKINR